jgi:hypothetical protein
MTPGNEYRRAHATLPVEWVRVVDGKWKCPRCDFGGSEGYTVAVFREHYAKQHPEFGAASGILKFEIKNPGTSRGAWRRLREPK